MSTNSITTLAKVAAQLPCNSFHFHDNKVLSSEFDHWTHGHGRTKFNVCFPTAKMGSLLSYQLYWLAMCLKFSNLFPGLEFSYLVLSSYPEELDCLKTSLHCLLNQKSLLGIPDTFQRHRPGPQEPGAHHLIGPWMDMVLRELLWMVEFLQKSTHRRGNISIKNSCFSSY